MYCTTLVCTVVVPGSSFEPFRTFHGVCDSGNVQGRLLIAVGCATNYSRSLAYTISTTLELDHFKCGGARVWHVKLERRVQQY